MNFTAETISFQGRRPLGIRRLSLWKPVATKLVGYGVSPNTISLLGLAAGVTAGLLISATSAGWPDDRLLLIAALVLIVGRGFCNILDGIMAVEAGAATRVGALYNEVPDRIADVALMLGAGYATGGHPVAGWAAAVAAVLTAYVRVQCELAGAGADFGGFFGKPGRMIVLAACMLYLVGTPVGMHYTLTSTQLGVMTLGSIMIAVGSIVTSAGRLRRAARVLSGATDHV